MKLSKESLERLEKLTNMKDEDIDLSDIPETDKEFWKDAKLIHPQNHETKNKN